MINVLNQITTVKDGQRVNYKIGDLIEGYYNTTNHKFYEESTYITEIQGVEGFIYVDKTQNNTYRYDLTTSSFIIIGGNSSSDYSELINKPSINSIALIGNKTLLELGAASKEDLDNWTTTSLVDSNNFVTFTGLSDNYSYSLYCEDKIIGIKAITKTGNGDNVTLIYTVSGALTGDVCKLRILK